MIYWRYKLTLTEYNLMLNVYKIGVPSISLPLLCPCDVQEYDNIRGSFTYIWISDHKMCLWLSSSEIDLGWVRGSYFIPDIPISTYFYKVYPYPYFSLRKSVWTGAQTRICISTLPIFSYCGLHTQLAIKRQTRKLLWLKYVLLFHLITHHYSIQSWMEITYSIYIESIFYIQRWI